MSLTMKDKQIIRRHMRQNGLNPGDYDTAGLHEYGMQHNLIEGDASIPGEMGGEIKDADTEGSKREESSEIPDDATFQGSQSGEGEDDAEGEAEGDTGDGEPGDSEGESGEAGEATGEGDSDGEGEGEDDSDDPLEDYSEPQEGEEPPPVPPAENPMDTMIDERIQAHLANHIWHDTHELPTRGWSKLVARMCERAVKRAMSKLPKQGGGDTYIKIAKRKPIKIKGRTHRAYEACVKVAANPELNLYMKGEAGSGKTHIGKQIADALTKGKFYMTGKVDDVYTLTGYKDASGAYVETDFYRAFKNGGTFLGDEFDRYSPEALIVINAAISNGFMAFPNGGVTKRHKDFIFIAAGNTFGNGAERKYSAGQVLDGSTKNRITTVIVDYDEELERERALAINDAAGPWVDFVQRARRNAEAAGFDVIISPRDSFNGAHLLNDGFTFAECKQMTFMAGLSRDMIAALES